MVESVRSQLVASPPIVDHRSIADLSRQLRDLHASPDGFLVHAGDCAETLASCIRERVDRDISFLHDLATIVDASIIIGRICGQFAKPRSSPVETHAVHGEIPVYRGDIINGVNVESRSADPSRMLDAYIACAGIIHQFQHPDRNVYVSHECLLLPYEASLVRQVGDLWYLTSAHFVWIGDRTRDLDGAHIEFCRGLANPIGIKIGPSSVPSEVRRCIERLNPDNVPGRITVITRFGSGSVRSKLPSLIHALNGLAVVWQCDPMHGNTVQRGPVKTRDVAVIKDEITDTVNVHREMGSRLHGIHLEATGSDVTECMGAGVDHNSLHLRYESACDPRLNPDQAREVLQHLALLLASTSPELKPCDRSESSRQTTACDVTDIFPPSPPFSSDEEGGPAW